MDPILDLAWRATTRPDPEPPGRPLLARRVRSWAEAQVGRSLPDLPAVAELVAPDLPTPQRVAAVARLCLTHLTGPEQVPQVAAHCGLPPETVERIRAGL